jgi:hypothetical protein
LLPHEQFLDLFKRTIQIEKDFGHRSAQAVQLIQIAISKGQRKLAVRMVDFLISKG